MNIFFLPIQIQNERLLISSLLDFCAKSRIGKTYLSKKVHVSVWSQKIWIKNYQFLLLKLPRNLWRFQILDFSASNENLNIGVLDIDLCGPSAPRLFGVVNEQVLLFWEYIKTIILMRGLCHIQTVDIGGEYWNRCRILNISLLINIFLKKNQT